jgi:hypothetical protein
LSRDYALPSENPDHGHAKIYIPHSLNTSQPKSCYSRTPYSTLAIEKENLSGYERLATLCDRIGNRLSGSESLLKAVKWSAEEMKEAGFTNVVTPPVMVPHWVRVGESAAILSPVEKPLTLC